MAKKNQETDPAKKGKSPKKLEMKMEFNLKRALIWVLILLLFLPFLFQMFGGLNSNDEIPISEMMGDVQQGKVEKMVDGGSQAEAHYKDSDVVKTAKK